MKASTLISKLFESYFCTKYKLLYKAILNAVHLYIAKINDVTVM